MLKAVFALLAVVFIVAVSPAVADDGGPCFCKCSGESGLLYQQSRESSDFFTRKFESGLKTVAACEALSGTSCSGRVNPLESAVTVGTFAKCEVPVALRQALE